MGLYILGKKYSVYSLVLKSDQSNIKDLDPDPKF